MTAPLCRCGHLAETHYHHRPGLDCGACKCPKLQQLKLDDSPGRRPWWRRIRWSTLLLSAGVMAVLGVGPALLIRAALFLTGNL